jgi:hypothetical protein
MSLREERRRAQRIDGRSEDQAMEQWRPAQIAVPCNPDRTAWDSQCAGWRGGFHERFSLRDRSRVEGETGKWRCRWCFQFFNPALNVRGKKGPCDG